MDDLKICEFTMPLLNERSISAGFNTPVTILRPHAPKGETVWPGQLAV